MNDKKRELEAARLSAQNLQADVAAANRQVKALEQKLTSLQTDVKQLEGTVGTLKSGNVKFQTELEEERQKCSGLELVCTSHLGEAEWGYWMLIPGD